MLVSDLYKVIEDDTPYMIEYCTKSCYGTLTGDDWNDVSQEILDKRIKNIRYSKCFEKIVIFCE